MELGSFERKSRLNTHHLQTWSLKNRQGLGGFTLQPDSEPVATPLQATTNGDGTDTSIE